VSRTSYPSLVLSLTTLGEKPYITLVIIGMSIDVEFHIDVGGDNFDIESFYGLRKFDLLQHLIDFSPNNHILHCS
jgi:hypothetical protein